MKTRLLSVFLLCVVVGFALSSAAPAVSSLSPLSPVSTVFAAPQGASVQLVAPYRVTVGATAVQLTNSTNVNGGVVIKAICPGQTLYIGISSAVTTSTGYPMSDGETLTLEVRNANQLYAIASAAAQSVAVLPFSRY